MTFLFIFDTSDNENLLSFIKGRSSAVRSKPPVTYCELMKIYRQPFCIPGQNYYSVQPRDKSIRSIRGQ